MYNVHGLLYITQVDVCICAKDGCNDHLTTTATTKHPAKTTTTPTASKTSTPAPSGALQCYKCNAVPNPGGGEEDACDAAEHIGKLVVRVIACLMHYDIVRIQPSRSPPIVFQLISGFVSKPI